MKRYLVSILAFSLIQPVLAEEWEYLYKSRNGDEYIRMVQPVGRFRIYEKRTVYNQKYKERWERGYANAIKFKKTHLWSPYSPIETMKIEVDCEYPLSERIGGGFRSRFISKLESPLDSSSKGWMDFPIMGTNWACK
tara:strand:+ start:488 stop:898 length:411 start_codon:yes stop_codon:yes gene_type:complete